VNLVATTLPPAKRRARLVEFLALERNVVLVSATMFCMGLAEQLWRRFIPKYMQALGAPVSMIGLYGSAEDALDGLYQYPGGWLADRFGRRRALVGLIGVALVGYAAYAAAFVWPLVFVGLVLSMAWTSMASPALFAVVGDALAPGRRAMGFTVQSIVRRLPVIVAPVHGGLMIARLGITAGVRTGLVAGLVIGLCAMGVAARVRLSAVADQASVPIRTVWMHLPRALRWLLASDVMIRTCEALVDVFIVLYAMSVIGISATQFGTLIAVQMATTIAVQVPASRMADTMARKPFVVLTFVMFALFPLAVVRAHDFASLCVAFVVGGLREIGEPARKALILDFVRPELRARSVGLYYLVRGLAIAPAAWTGGVLWHTSPVLPFYIASAIGFCGVITFNLTVEAKHAA
jgi:MFS family permease